MRSRLVLGFDPIVCAGSATYGSGQLSGVLPKGRSMDKLSAVDDNNHGEARRTFLKKAANITPAILTLKAVPSFASYGSAPAPTGPEAAVSVEASSAPAQGAQGQSPQGQAREAREIEEEQIGTGRAASPTGNQPRACFV